MFSIVSSKDARIDVWLVGDHYKAVGEDARKLAKLCRLKLFKIGGEPVCSFSMGRWCQVVFELHDAGLRLVQMETRLPDALCPQ